MKGLGVRFTHLSPTHNRFEAIRPDGPCESLELETRRFLFHDFAHFTLESQAGLKHSFYGLLARGGAYDAASNNGEAMATESVVGPLQSASKGEPDPDAFVARFRAVQQDIGAHAPTWLTPELIARAEALAPTPRPMARHTLRSDHDARISA